MRSGRKSGRAQIGFCPQRGVWILCLQQEAVGGFETEEWHVRSFQLLGVGEADEGDNGEQGGQLGVGLIDQVRTKMAWTRAEAVGAGEKRLLWGLIPRPSGQGLADGRRAVRETVAEQ